MGEQPIWEPSVLEPRPPRYAEPAGAIASRARERGPRPCGRWPCRRRNPARRRTRDAMVGVDRAGCGCANSRPWASSRASSRWRCCPIDELFVAERAGLPVGILSVAPIYDRRDGCYRICCGRQRRRMAPPSSVRPRHARGACLRSADGDAGPGPTGRRGAGAPCASRAGPAATCSISKGCTPSRRNCGRRAGTRCTCRSRRGPRAYERWWMCSPRSRAAICCASGSRRSRGDLP